MPTAPKSGESAQSYSVNSLHLDNMFRVATVVRGSVSEEEKIVVITKMILKLMKQNGH
jgi:hypothetical protein